MNEGTNQFLYLNLALNKNTKSSHQYGVSN